MLTKKMLATMLGALIVGATAGGASASDFPDKPIRIIAPSSPGGILDLTSRLVAEKMSEKLGGHPVVVENMPGGGGIIGIQGMLRAQPDGHVLVMGSLGPNAANYSLYSKLPYEPGDFAPVMNVISMPSVLVVNPKVPASTMDEFKQYATEQGGNASMAISTMGASGHLIGEMMKNDMGISAINVVYKGAAPAMNDLVAGHVNFMIDNMITARPMIEGDRVKAIAVFSADRSPLLPDVPTVSQQGYPQLTGGTWIGLLTSAKVPQDRVEKLNKVLNEVIADPQVQASLVQSGGEPIGGTPDEFAAFIDSEIKRWSDVIKAAGISIQ